jgi:hypothetical protein
MQLQSKRAIEGYEPGGYQEVIHPDNPAKPSPLYLRVEYWCKHPEREKGKGWPLAAVSLPVLQ